MCFRGHGTSMIQLSLKRGGVLLGEGVLESNHKIQDEKPHSNQSKQIKTNGYYARKYNQHLAILSQILAKIFE